MTRNVKQLLSLIVAILMLTNMCITNVFAATTDEANNSSRYGVQKVWDDNNNEAGARPQSVTVELYANGEPTGQRAVLNESNNWAYTWESLDSNKSYQAVEIDLPQNYTVTSKQVPESKFVVTAYDRITKCNELIISVPTSDSELAYADFLVVSLTASVKDFGENEFIIWTENELSDANKAVIVGWIRQNGDALFQKIAVDTTIFLYNGGENLYSQFVTFEKDENQIVGTSLGAKAVWQQVLYGCGYAAPAYTELTNTYVPPVHTLGSIVVTKNATGAATPAGTTFQLQKLEGNDWANIGEAVAFSSFANNAYNFTGLEEGTYRIAESGAEVDGYTLETTYSANVVLTKTTADNGDTSVSNGSITVTNNYTEIHIPVHTLGSIVLTKNATGTVTPAATAFQLQKLSGDTWTNVGEAVEYSAFVDGAYTFAELAEGTYRVVESGAEVADFNLTTTYSDNVVLNKTTADNGDTSVDDGAIFVTNTYTEIYLPVHTLGSILITKNTSGATTPADATFQLQKMEGDERINVGEPVAYSAFVENAYTFTELEEGTYRVVESGAEIEEFRLETTYGENVVLTKTTAENGDTSVSSGSALVTNIYTPYIHTPGSITVNKIATGAATPAGATFQLQKLNGETWTNVGEAVAYSSFVNNAYKFAGLEEGTYRVVETSAEVEGFNLTTRYSADAVLEKATADNGDTTVSDGRISVTNVYTAETVEIPDEDVPLAPTPDDDDDDEIIEIPDEDVPMADVPKTGDPILQYVGLAITSGVAAIFVGKIGKKKEDEE